MTKEQLAQLIEQGVKLSSEQDDLCYATFTPEEYLHIPAAQRPDIPETIDQTPQDTVAQDIADIKKMLTDNHQKSDLVLIGLQKAQHIFHTVDPVAWLTGQDYVEWMVTSQAIDAALNDCVNPQHTTAADRVKAQPRGKPVKCVTDGKEHPSITSAAKFYKIPPTSISNHLAGRYGFATVKGLKFERLTT